MLLSDDISNPLKHKFVALLTLALLLFPGQALPSALTWRGGCSILILLFLLPFQTVLTTKPKAETSALGEFQHFLHKRLTNFTSRHRNTSNQVQLS